MDRAFHSSGIFYPPATGASGHAEPGCPCIMCMLSSGSALHRCGAFVFLSLPQSANDDTVQVWAYVHGASISTYASMLGFCQIALTRPLWSLWQPWVKYSDFRHISSQMCRRVAASWQCMTCFLVLDWAGWMFGQHPWKWSSRRTLPRSW